MAELIENEEDLIDDTMSEGSVESSHSGVFVRVGMLKIDPVTKIGRRLYMFHMLLLPFLPIIALLFKVKFYHGSCCLLF